MQIRDGGGDPTPVGLAAGGAVVVLITTGGAAAAANGTNWIAPSIALVGAVFVAILTAITTNRRQAKQLAADEKRQVRELAHQRDLAELAHLREFFDEAAAAFERRGDAIDNWASFIAKSPREPVPKEEPEGFQEATQPIIGATARMGIAHRRMGLRLPVDHPVSRAYYATVEAQDAHLDALNDLYRDGTFEHEAHRALLLVDMGAWRVFVDAARAELDRRAAVTE